VLFLRIRGAVVDKGVALVELVSPAPDRSPECPRPRPSLPYLAGGGGRRGAGPGLGGGGRPDSVDESVWTAATGALAGGRGRW
jgi:hypothetical protein